MRFKGKVVLGSDHFDVCSGIHQVLGEYDNSRPKYFLYDLWHQFEQRDLCNVARDLALHVDAFEGGVGQWGVYQIIKGKGELLNRGVLAEGSCIFEHIFSSERGHRFLGVSWAIDDGFRAISSHSDIAKKSGNWYDSLPSLSVSEVSGNGVYTVELALPKGRSSKAYSDWVDRVKRLFFEDSSNHVFSHFIEMSKLESLVFGCTIKDIRDVGGSEDLRSLVRDVLDAICGDQVKVSQRLQFVTGIGRQDAVRVVEKFIDDGIVCPDAWTMYSGSIPRENVIRMLPQFSDTLFEEVDVPISWVQSDLISAFVTRAGSQSQSEGVELIFEMNGDKETCIDLIGRLENASGSKILKI